MNNGPDSQRESPSKDQVDDALLEAIEHAAMKVSATQSPHQTAVGWAEAAERLANAYSALK
jgi:hypothetical protein